MKTCEIIKTNGYECGISADFVIDDGYREFYSCKNCYRNMKKACIELKIPFVAQVKRLDKLVEDCKW